MPNTHLTHLKQSIEELHSQAQNHLQQLGDEATFADQFLVASTQAQLEFIQQTAANDKPLTFEELNAQPISPHLLYDAHAIFTGDPVIGHKLPIKLLGEFLIECQEMISGLGKYAALTAKLSEDVQRVAVPKNEILCSGVFAGSFGIGFTVATEVERSGQITLFEGEVPEATLPNPALELFHQVMNGEISKTELRNILGGARVENHYRKLVELLAKHGATVSVSVAWEAEASTLSAERAGEFAFWLKHFQTQDETEVIRGTLQGGSIEYDRFEIRVDEKTFIKGRMTADAARDFERLKFGEAVRALVKVVTTSSSDTDAEKKTYILQRVTPQDEILSLEN